MDVDLPTAFEAHTVVGAAAKLLYSLVYMILYSVRPLVTRPKPIGRDELLNVAIMMAFDAALVMLWGWRVLLYLGLSVLLGGGLHPLAAHLIAEHYVFRQVRQCMTFLRGMVLLCGRVFHDPDHQHVCPCLSVCA